MGMRGRNAEGMFQGGVGADWGKEGERKRARKRGMSGVVNAERWFPRPW